jgi:uncharacterized protein YbaR (Trm112 family)
MLNVLMNRTVVASHGDVKQRVGAPDGCRKTLRSARLICPQQKPASRAALFAALCGPYIGLTSTLRPLSSRSSEKINVAPERSVLSKEFIAMMRCPENRTPLALAGAGLLAQVNQAISAGRLKNRAGLILVDRLAGGLVRQDQAVLYPINLDEIPILLLDEGVLLSQLH